ncbi:MAG: hypothetical protein EHM20_14955, partial [Alphaproteobacteria bacterium]
MKTNEINKEFNQIVSDLKKDGNVPLESVVQVAQIILQESGKDRRTAIMRESKMIPYEDDTEDNQINDTIPATPRQKNA